MKREQGARKQREGVKKCGDVIGKKGGRVEGGREGREDVYMHMWSKESSYHVEKESERGKVSEMRKG